VGHLASIVDGQELQYPLSIAVADDDTFYLGDRNLPGVWQLKGNQLTKLFEGSKKFRTPLNAIRCVELDNEGNLLAGDSATRDIYRFDDGKPQPLTRDGDTFGRIGIPMDIAVSSNGEIYVTDLELQRLVKIPSSGGKPTEVAQISGCRGLAVDSDNNIWVVSTTSDQLYRVSPDGAEVVVVKGRPFDFPHTVVVDDAGIAYVCDGFAKAIWKVAPDQEPQKWVSGEPFVNPVGMARFGDKLLVADPRANALFEVDPDGNVKTFFPN
jgi:hypothetical protein